MKKDKKLRTIARRAMLLAAAVMCCAGKNAQWLQSRSRLMAVPTAMLLFVLSVQAQPTITAASNPVVVPNGQAFGSTTITWKAAPDYTYSEIYLSVDNADWSEFARGADSSKPATLKLGSSYTFRMMVYEGQQGTPKVITTLTVSTKQGGLAPPQAGGGGDSVSEVKDRGSDYRVFPIRNVRVEPGPRHIMIRFHGPPNQTPYVAIGRGAPIKGQDGEWVFGDNLVGGGFVGPGTVSAAEKAKGEYMFASAFGTTFSENGLEPGRTYYYIITVGEQSGRSYQDTGRFVMRQLATTVKVVWERVLVIDDSDDLSTGEINFWFWANYGQPGSTFSQYYNGDADSGHAYDLSRSVVIVNAPSTLSLSANGRDDDSNALNHGFFDASLPPLSGPGSTSAADENVANDTFDLTKYDDNATVNFVLNTAPRGNLQFTIFGHFEITRTTASAGSGNSENIGTTSSALGTDTGALNPPPPRQFIGTFGTTPPNYQPMWVYAIKNDGDMLWYRKDTGGSPWQGPKKVGNGWNFKDVIPAGGNAFYALTDDGKMFWYRHDGFNDGSARNWPARVEIGHGWGFTKIFSGGEGIVYAIKEDGDLLWYKHGGFADGGGPATWTGGKSVGVRWNGFKDVFSNGGGDIYAITPGGDLIYYHQPGYATGEPRFLPARTIATGWQSFRQVIPAGGGVILAIKEDGKLLWYRHYFKATGTTRLSRVKEYWEGPVEIGSGWLGFKKVIALLPVAASAPVVR